MSRVEMMRADIVHCRRRPPPYGNKSSVPLPFTRCHLVPEHTVTRGHTVAVVETSRRGGPEQHARLTQLAQVLDHAVSPKPFSPFS